MEDYKLESMHVIVLGGKHEKPHSGADEFEQTIFHESVELIPLLM